MHFRSESLLLVASILLAGCGSTEIREVPVAEDETPSPEADVHALALGELNRIAGHVRVADDGATLTVSVTAYEGFRLADTRVCIGTTAFSWIPAQSCGLLAPISGADTTKTNVAIPLDMLGEPVAGDVLYLQIGAKVIEAGAEAGYAYAGTFKGRIAYTASGRVEPRTAASCTLSAGEWSGEKKEWPVEKLVLGGAEYGKEELKTLLATQPAGDASVSFARQLVAAQLNAASGAELPLGIANALEMSKTWLAAHEDHDGTLPFGITAAPGDELNPASFDYAVNTGEMVRQFNDGRLAVPRCD